MLPEENSRLNLLSVCGRIPKTSGAQIHECVNVSNKYSTNFTHLHTHTHTHTHLLVNYLGVVLSEKNQESNNEREVIMKFAGSSKEKKHILKS